MKGKKILSLVSLVAGASIVGATFAAWAVTDKADPFGIKVSPGSIEPDKTRYVTLEYGDRTFANIENIKAGESRLGATVALKATTSDNTSYKGKFNLTLINQTQKTGEDAKYLLNYLEVDVYDVAITEDADGKAIIPDGAVPIGHVPVTGDVQDKYTTDIDIVCPSGTPKVVYVVVTLDESADASVMPEIANDIVFLQMNWNRYGGAEEVEAGTVYAKLNAALGENENVYCYAWKGDSVNAQYPGKEMKQVDGLYYSYDINLANFEKCLFVVYNTSTKAEVAKSLDITIANIDFIKAPTYQFSNGEFAPAPVIDPTLVDPYYVVGEHKGSWAPNKDFGMKLVEGKSDEYISGDIQFAAGEEFKLVDKAQTDWRASTGTWENCGFTINSENGNMVVTKAGVYKVYLDKTPDTTGHEVSLILGGDEPIAEFAWGIASSESSWKLDTSRLLVESKEEKGAGVYAIYEIASAAFAKDETWKITNTNGEWISNRTTDGGCGLDTALSDAAFSIDTDGNIAVSTAGNYKVKLVVYEGSVKDQYGNFQSGMQIIATKVA